MFNVKSQKLFPLRNGATLLRLVAAFMFVIGLSSTQLHAKNASAEAYVKNVGNKVLKVMSSADSDSAKKSKFRSLFIQHADTRRIGKAALGKYSRKIGNKQAEYNRLLKDYVVKVYYKNLISNQGNNLKIVRSIDKPKEARVITVFKSNSGRNIDIMWRLVKTGGGFKIFDLHVSGASLLQAQTAAFNSVISKNGGDPASIIDFMKKQIAKKS